MELKFKGYTVEIKAKYEWSKRYNKKDTIALLNTMSCDLMELADYLEKDASEVHRACAKYRRQESNELFDFLDALGVYDGDN